MNINFREINLPYLKSGNKISIKKSHEGKFTNYCNGKVTDECIKKGKNSSNPEIRKLATFAQNARIWKHQLGGNVPNYVLFEGYTPTNNYQFNFNSSTFKNPISDNFYDYLQNRNDPTVTQSQENLTQSTSTRNTVDQAVPKQDSSIPQYTSTTPYTGQVPDTIAKVLQKSSENRFFSPGKHRYVELGQDRYKRLCTSGPASFYKDALGIELNGNWWDTGSPKTARKTNITKNGFTEKWTGDGADVRNGAWKNYVRPGDIMVCFSSRSAHAQMWDGKRWISDTYQTNPWCYNKDNGRFGKRSAILYRNDSLWNGFTGSQPTTSQNSNLMVINKNKKTLSVGGKIEFLKQLRTGGKILKAENGTSIPEYVQFTFNKNNQIKIPSIYDTLEDPFEFIKNKIESENIDYRPALSSIPIQTSSPPSTNNNTISNNTETLNNISNNTTTMSNNNIKEIFKDRYDLAEKATNKYLSGESLNRARQAIGYLMKFGLSKLAACSSVAVFLSENHCDPKSYNEKEKNGGASSKLASGGGYGAGIGSWTGKDKKRKALSLIGKSPDTPIESLSMEDQCKMYALELQSKKGNQTVDKLLNGTPEESAVASMFYTHGDARPTLKAHGYTYKAAYEEQVAHTPKLMRFAGRSTPSDYHKSALLTRVLLANKLNNLI